MKPLDKLSSIKECRKDSGKNWQEGRTMKEITTELNKKAKILYVYMYIWQNKYSKIQI